MGMTEDQIREQKAKENLLAFENLFRTDKDLKIYSERLEAEVQKRTADLSIRVKELNCLFSMSRLIEEQGNSLEAILDGIVNLVPNGWQYPEITCARLKGKRYCLYHAELEGNSLETRKRYYTRRPANRGIGNLLP